MSDNWNNNTPIYRQIRDRVAKSIMNGNLSEGEAIPSVRSVASESKVNHLTVGKAYQELVDEGVLEMQRGRGMFVVAGARDALLAQERTLFIEHELPNVLERVNALGISLEELLSLIKTSKGRTK